MCLAHCVGVPYLQEEQEVVPGHSDVQQAGQPKAAQSHVPDIGVLILDRWQELRGRKREREGSCEKT